MTAMTITETSYIDLHIHTTCSDGAYSPTEIVRMAATVGLSTIAIADHDSVAGIGEAIKAGAGEGIRIIPAVELSVQFEEWKDVHLLGYGLDFNDRRFLEQLNRFRERRERRNVEILERVNELLLTEQRVPVPLAEVLAYAQDAIGRPHIARALLARGYADNVEDAFKRYLVPCNVPKLYWPISDAIAEIRRTGGVAVLAHPTTISQDRTQLRRIILELVALGLSGIEVYNNMGYPEEMEFLRRLALEQGLIMTGGSDFHGIEDGLEMGKGRGGIRFEGYLLTPLYEQFRAEQLL